MMWDLTPRKVLVAIETADAHAALRAAAAEAMRRRCGVHVLHVLPPVYASHPHIEELSLIAGELQFAGTAVVQEAAQELEGLLPDELVVSAELCHGAVVHALVETSAHACLLVLQHRLHESGPTPLLSVTQSVAAHAQCPVLAVPDTWTGEPTTGRPLVVAGIQDAARSTRVVEIALEEASRRHARLAVVHGTSHAGVGDMEPAAYAAWTRMLTRELESSLAATVSRHPDVPVDVQVRPEDPTAALAAAATGAVMVVVGRGHSSLPFLGRPGPTTADVLRHAVVPVLVVDTDQARTARSADRRHEVPAGATV